MGGRGTLFAASLRLQDGLGTIKHSWNRQAYSLKHRLILDRSTAEGEGEWEGLFYEGLTFRIDNYIVVCLVTWPWIGSEAGGDFVWI